jgi:hypothetical protein
MASYLKKNNPCKQKGRTTTTSVCRMLVVREKADALKDSGKKDRYRRIPVWQ